MNKYARIDTQCSKAQVYYLLYNEHGMKPSDIAIRFNITVKTVCRSIQIAGLEQHIFSGDRWSWKRARQLAWTYAY